MRNAFAAEMTDQAARDSQVVLLSGDIGNRLFDKFKDTAPGRFFNCGVAEANMITMGAGMAMSGLRPVAYTITPFITTRVMEQIRNDVCYHNVPMTIVGVGSGLSYASLGATHHSCEDIAMLRALPNMTVLAPADAHEVRAAIRASLDQDGPVYIRMGKKGEPLIHDDVPPFTIGRGIVLREGGDVCLLGTGTMLPTVIEAADKLAKAGIAAQIVSLHTIKPLDEELLGDVFARCRAVATIEEHSVIGGLGGAVSEWMADNGPQRARLIRFGTEDAFIKVAGETDYAREAAGLTARHIFERVVRALD